MENWNMANVKKIIEELDCVYESVSSNSKIELSNSFVVDPELFIKMEIDPSFKHLGERFIGTQYYREAEWRGFTIYTFKNCSKGVFASVRLVEEERLY